jgi:hypothetical protein
VTQYSVQVRVDSKGGPVVFEKHNLFGDRTSDAEHYVIKTKPLPGGKTYFWRVTAFNEKGSGGSVWHSFSRP